MLWDLSWAERPPTPTFRVLSTQPSNTTVYHEERWLGKCRDAEIEAVCIYGEDQPRWPRSSC